MDNVDFRKHAKALRSSHDPGSEGRELMELRLKNVIQQRLRRSGRTPVNTYTDEEIVSCSAVDHNVSLLNILSAFLSWHSLRYSSRYAFGS